jgi:hypothetical protein
VRKLTSVYAETIILLVHCYADRSMHLFPGSITFTTVIMNKVQYFEIMYHEIILGSQVKNFETMCSLTRGLNINFTDMGKSDK